MNINWFPGHMAKSIRMMEDNLKLIDVVIYVLDSRAPFSCLNPLFDRLFAGKPIIYVLNKSDLGVESFINEWIKVLSTDNSAAVAIDSTASKSGQAIAPLVKKMALNKLIKYEKKGIKITLKAMVAGVPNSGKSTLINNLSGSGKTVTGNKPGVTKGKQWVRVNEYFELLDTPGTLYPKLSDQKIAKHLAYIGSIKDEITDVYELACSLLIELNDYDGNIIKRRYNVEFDIDVNITMEKMAFSRGYMLKGNEPDIQRMANAFLDDFRKGRLGQITLETAGDYKKFLEEKREEN